MALNATELREVAAELDARLRGAFVQKVFAPLPKLALVEVRQPGRSEVLVLSAESDVARLALSPPGERPPAPPRPLPFQSALRKLLVGARLEQVTSPSPHVALLHFEHREGRRTLALVTSGADANVLLIDDSLRLLAASTRTPHTPKLREVWSPPELAEDGAPSRLPQDANVSKAQAAQDLLAPKAEGQRADVVRKRLLAPLKTKVQRLRRTLEKVHADLARAQDAPVHREDGELLAQNLHRIPRGATQVTLTRYAAEGPEEVTLKLDPKRSPKEQVDWHFHQYRRLQRGEAHARRRLEELQTELDETVAQMEAVRAQSDDALAAEAPKLIQEEAAAKKKGPERKKPYKLFVAQTGHRIFVGKGSEANDELTFHLALPHHLWFHARGVPGSHVVLERKKGEEVPHSAIIDAAHLAHHHGKRKDEPQGEVAWTEARYGRKTKGAAAGAVTYTREKVVLLRVEPERLQRLLRSSPI